MCPYCNLKNLDCPTLRKHCNDGHADCKSQVVTYTAHLFLYLYFIQENEIHEDFFIKFLFLQRTTYKE